MRVLLINTYHHIRGGDSSYTFNLADVLRRHGHEVIFFSMKHPSNIRCENEKYFVDYIDFREMNENKNILNAFRVASRVIYYREAKKRIKKLISDTAPDIAHLQTVHGHITPSVLDTLKSEGVPAVWSLHDYKLICPNTNLFSKGATCEACRGGKYFQCTLKKCKKDSRSASLLASVEAIFHGFLKIHEKVSYFISPSQFLIDKFAQFEWPTDRFVRLPYCLPPAAKCYAEDGGYALFLGRIESYKGVRTLVKAASLNKDLRLKIAGTGSELQAMSDLALEMNLDNVEFLGYKHGDELNRFIRECSYIVVPSEWYENYPYVVMEGMTAAKPIIASRIGGLPEMVEDGISGYLFDPQNHAELAEKMKLLSADSHLREKMGARGVEKAAADFDPEKHYENIVRIYSNALNQ